ncbi:MAG: hypothetical protein ACOY3Y_17380 [Acidobacteriota bacterium]
MDRPATERLAGAAGLLVLASCAWFALDMHKGPLLSEHVKAMVWPWAPFAAPGRPLVQDLTDPVWQFVPWLEFARRELHAGRLPLWNPHQDGGVPLLGNGQSALASPLVAPVLLFGVELGWNLSLLARLLLAAVGGFLWLRCGGASRAGAATGAAMFAFSGPFVGWLAHPHAMVAAAAPWVLLSAERTVRARGSGAVAGLAVSTWLCLVGGHPQTAVMVTLLAAARVLSLTRAPAALGRVGGGAALGAGLAAPVILPFAEYLAHSAALHGNARAPLVLPVEALVRFVSAGADVGPRVEAAATVSLAGLALAVVGLVVARREADARFWAGALAVVLLVSYDNPISRALAEATPVHWSRGLLLVPLSLGWLAARGVAWIAGGACPATGVGWRRIVAWSAPLAIAAALLQGARGVHPVAESASLGVSTPMLEHLRADKETFRILPLHTFLPSNSATTLGLDDVRGFDSMAPRAWRRTREAIGRFTLDSNVEDVLEPWDLAPGGRALDEWNVKYLLVHPQLPYGAAEMNRSFGLDLESVYEGPDGRLLRNRRVLPRVRLDGSGSTTVVERTPMRWRIDCSVPSPARLVVANPYFPGWQVRLDGRRVHPHVSDGAPFEVQLPAGEHRVELVYRPVPFAVGCTVTALALAALAVLARRVGRSGKPAEHAEVVAGGGST